MAQSSSLPLRPADAVVVAQTATPKPQLEDLHPIHTPGVDKPQTYKSSQQFPSGLEALWADTGKYCPSCFTVSRDLGLFTNPKVIEEKMDDLYVMWYVNLAQLADSASKHCQFCCLMLVRLFNNPYYTFTWTTGSTEAPFSCCWRGTDHGSSKEVVEAIARTQEKCQKYGDIWFLVIARPSDFSEDQRYFERIRFNVDRTTLTTGPAVDDVLGPTRQIFLEFSAAEDMSSADFVLARPLNVTPKSRKSFDLARSWVEECLEYHDECHNQVLDAILPTRVIDLSRLEDGEAKLVKGNIAGQYTTLSYCWGGPQRAATTTDNAEDRESGFNLEELPKTLEDALWITKFLGVNYVWIDSLCILQDSVADKQMELPKMAAYYKNAVVTVCAGAQSCEEGFLKEHSICPDHNDSDLPQDLLRMPFLCPNGRLSDIFFREYQRYQLSQEPVSLRAWTFQEKILSPRMLFYGQRMLWHCSSLQESAGGVQQDWESDTQSAKSRLVQAKLSAIWRNKADLSLPSSEVPSASEESRDDWYFAVNEYSARNLSFLEDKLPAIGALAAEFADFYQDEYTAGLWRKTLLRDLLWSTWPKLDVIQPSKWRAPSWSWASVENTVSYHRLPPPSARALSEVVKISTEPKSKQVPHGEVDDNAFLILRGPIIEPDSKVLDTIMQKEYRIPGPQDSFAWRNLMLDSMSNFKDDQDEKRKKKTWNVPEGSIMLILFANPITEDNQIGGPTDQKPESSERSQSTDRLAATDSSDKIMGSVSEAAESDSSKNRENEIASPESLPADSLSDDNDAAETAERNIEKEQKSFSEEEKQEMSKAATTFGLVLAPLGNGKYERIGSFHELRVSGWAYLKKREKTVTIV